MTTTKPGKAEVVCGPGKVPIELNVNGRDYSLYVEPRRTLLEALRLDLHLTGTKRVCDMGECGACTVLLDGKAAYSCLMLAVECRGHKIETIENLSRDGGLNPIQKSFVEHTAFQCGFCTPGQIMSVKGLLDHRPSPDKEQIRKAVSGNICRCGAYPRIFKAAADAARAYAKKRR